MVQVSPCENSTELSDQLPAKRVQFSNEIFCFEQMVAIVM